VIGCVEEGRFPPTGATALIRAQGGLAYAKGGRHKTNAPGSLWRPNVHRKEKEKRKTDPFSGGEPGCFVAGRPGPGGIE